MASVAQLATALGLYRGDLVPEEGPAEWAVEHRERFRAELSRFTLDGVCGQDERGRILVVHRLFDLGDRLRSVFTEVAENPNESSAELGAATLE